MHKPPFSSNPGTSRIDRRTAADGQTIAIPISRASVLTRDNKKRAMFGGSEYFTKPMKVTENSTIRNLGTVFHSRCKKSNYGRIFSRFEVFRHNTDRRTDTPRRHRPLLCT